MDLPGDYCSEGMDTGNCRLIVSACLAGFDCRYDGGNCCDQKIVEMCRKGEAYPVCPEELGGMATPRPASEITLGSGEDVLFGKALVVNTCGEDVTRCFVDGACKTLKIVQELNIENAILKSHSPACGMGQIYRNKELVEGNGVCAALLLSNGVSVTCR